MSNHCFIMLLTLNCHWPSTDQPLGGGGGSTRGQEMMERGLKKLANSTPQWNTVRPKVSGIQASNTRIKQEPNDLLFGMSSSDVKQAVPGKTGTAHDDWLPITSRLRSRMMTYVIGKES